MIHTKIDTFTGADMDVDKDQLLALLREKPRHERIVTLRSLYNLSQAGLAKIAKVQRGTVSTWEADTSEVQGGRGHEPGKIARNRMGAYFNVPAYVFTDEWGDPSVAQKKTERPKQFPRKISDASIRVPDPNVKIIG